MLCRSYLGCHSPLPLLVFVALAASLSGCVRGIYADPSGYDAQACAERGLRGEVDRETLLQATAMFRDACDFGDPGACSSLGIIYERGLGEVSLDVSKAASLYRRACDRGNVHGCDNLRMVVSDRFPALASGGRDACGSGGDCTFARAAGR